MTENSNSNWSENADANETYHTPEGTFTKSAPEIVRVLMQGANGHAELALKRLVFYMNRAGNKLPNQEQIQKAKAIIEDKIESAASDC